MFALLPHRAVLRISGADALPFLQGLLTCDVMRLPERGAQFAALLTPQGKYLHSFFLYWQDGAVLLDVARDRLPDLLARLNMYRLRSQVAMEETALNVGAFWGEAPALPAAADPRLDALGFRAVAQALPQATARAEDYDAHRLVLGVPEDFDLTPDKSFPLQFGFEDLHAVDFAKGCYVGQEVTARTKHRGQLAKILCSVRGTLPEKGARLLAGGADAGEMLSGRDGVGLALVTAEAAKSGAKLTHASGEVSPSIATWFKAGLNA